MTQILNILVITFEWLTCFSFCKHLSPKPTNLIHARLVNVSAPLLQGPWWGQWRREKVLYLVSKRVIQNRKSNLKNFQLTLTPETFLYTKKC